MKIKIKVLKEMLFKIKNKKRSDISSVCCHQVR